MPKEVITIVQRYRVGMSFVLLPIVLPSGPDAVTRLADSEQAAAFLRDPLPSFQSCRHPSLPSAFSTSIVPMEIKNHEHP